MGLISMQCNEDSLFAHFLVSHNFYVNPKCQQGFFTSSLVRVWWEGVGELWQSMRRVSISIQIFVTILTHWFFQFLLNICSLLAGKVRHRPLCSLSTLFSAHLYLGSRVSSLLSINQGAKVSTLMKGSNKKEVKISVSHISILAILPSHTQFPQ